MKAPTQAELDWWRWRRQGLDEPRGSAAEILTRSGWMRSVGGAGPYLGLFARGRLSRGDVDAAVGALAIHELPSARGCTYVVPAADYAVALRASQGHGDAATVAMAKKYLGVTDQEIERLCKAIVDALDKAPLDPKGLKEALGGAVRHLGDEGKKRGTTTTLSLGLGLLQSGGEIRRVPEDGRLDRQRYRYARWKSSPLGKTKLDDATLARELATRFFRWTGPGTAAELAWWAGIGVKQAKAAIAELSLADVDGERVMFADDREELMCGKPPKSPPVRLVGSLDNLWHLGKLEIDHHAIVAGGARVGVWEFDFEAQKIVWALTDKAAAKDKPKGLEKAVAEMEAFARDQLGDVRSFSLDSPESRKPAIAKVRKLAR
ncbi:MAG TPA: crosslink repair DNA glycosylase YcaQ family protein [Polyangia bacterium]|nr:crosslink repair DNA glycosylase YcaQ family protein [Polyangia bacterium]